MQHIEIHDANQCTIVNIDGGATKAPSAKNSRVCRQCDQPTWRLTPVCAHCGYDRWLRYRIAAGSTAGAAALALVIFHPLG
jgi:ribosomal protein L37E